jgi:hypothetical protein
MSDKKPKIQMRTTRAFGKADLLDDKPQASEEPRTTSRTEYKKTLVTLPVSDIAWVSDEARRHRKERKLQMNKSEVIQIALQFMRKKGGLRQALKEIADE